MVYFVYMCVLSLCASFEGEKNELLRGKVVGVWQIIRIRAFFLLIYLIREIVYIIIIVMLAKGFGDHNPIRSLGHVRLVGSHRVPIR